MAREMDVWATLLSLWPLRREYAVENGWTDGMDDMQIATKFECIHGFPRVNTFDFSHAMALPLLGCHENLTPTPPLMVRLC